MKRMMLLALATATYQLSNAFAAVSLPDNEAEPRSARQIVEQVCVACHGLDGNSVVSTYPSLAGQHPVYLYNQLKAFKSGQRKNPQMMGMAAPLSDVDMKNLAAYFSEQTPKIRDASDKTSFDLGKRIYQAGIPATRVPACMSCHGPNGAGIPDQFPRIASQHADYIRKQLQDFKNAKDRHNPMMYEIANRLSDAEINAVANYISGLR